MSATKILKNVFEEKFKRSYDFYAIPNPVRWGGGVIEVPVLMWQLFGSSSRVVDDFSLRKEIYDECENKMKVIISVHLPDD